MCSLCIAKASRINLFQEASLYFSIQIEETKQLAYLEESKAEEEK
jgi:hypothetical protein